MQERTEDLIFAHRIDLQVGTNAFRGTVLSSGKAAEWREKYFAAINAIMSGASAMVETIDEGFFSVAAKVILSDPTKMVELMYEYDPGLPKDFFAEATDEEIELNFARICKLAFPSKGLLSIVMERLGTTLPLALAKLSKQHSPNGI
jgi:hypothetical protein